MAGTDAPPATPQSPAPEPSHQDLRRRRGTLTLVAAAVVFGALTTLVRLGWTPLQSVDSAVAQAVNRVVAPNPALVSALKILTTLGSAGVLVWLVVLTGLVLLVRRRFRLAGYLAVTTAGALVLDPTLKALIGRLRPEVPDPVAIGGGNSFPSGHSLDSLISYGALLLVLLPAVPRRHRRWVVGVVAGVVFLIGLSRIALGVHFVSDVVGAWCLGTAWLGLTVYAFELFRNRTGRPVPQPLKEGVEPEAANDVTPTEPAPVPRHDLVRMTAWVVVGWVFTFGVIVGIGQLVKRGGDNLLGDRAIPAWLAARRTAGLNSFSDFWSQAGNTHAIMAVGLVAGAVALGVIRRWRPVVFLVVLMMGELSLFLTSAKIIGRDRPAVAHLDGPLPTSAYPSGHIAATLCLYVGIALLVLPRMRAWWRWLILVPVVAMPVLVGLSRMYRGMHHPTDVLASVLLSAAWITIGYLVIRPNLDLEGGPTPRIQAPTPPAATQEAILAAR